MTTRVLVLGAGFGGLETCARLDDLLGDEVEITLIDKGPAFVFGFSKLDVMFGRQQPDEVRLRYEDYARPRVRFVHEAITAIDPVARTATTTEGTYSGDVLVVALGADYDLDATPGLADLGREFYSTAGAFAARDTLAAFEGGDVVIGVCGPGFKCPPAPNECALLLHDQLVARGLRERSSITVVVPMGVPLPPSPELSEAILRRYDERGITYVGGHRVLALEQDGGWRREAILDDGSRLPFDLFLGIPVHRVPVVVAESGLAENGWIPVDKGSAATRFPGVYAVGDVTSVGTPKAGVFAERAADAMVEQVVARIRGEAEPPGYDGTGACYVELGAGQVGHIAVDFFADPSRPRGWFDEPGDGNQGAKAAFGAARRERWFGPGA
jgi:sulfide:quinone oxidoreductase